MSGGEGCCSQHEDRILTDTQRRCLAGLHEPANYHTSVLLPSHRASVVAWESEESLDGYRVLGVRVCKHCLALYVMQP